MLEKQIENLILSYLKSKKILAWQNSSVGIFDAKIGKYRRKNSIHRIVGVSDILGIYAGRFLAIEVKSEKGRLSLPQKEFIDQINAQGGIAFVARSIEDVESNLFHIRPKTVSLPLDYLDNWIEKAKAK